VWQLKLGEKLALGETVVLGEKLALDKTVVLGEKLALGTKLEPDAILAHLEPVLRILASASPLGLGAKLGN
jgi:hypothetical protein